jgi:hypothetical protein
LPEPLKRVGFPQVKQSLFIAAGVLSAVSSFAQTNFTAQLSLPLTAQPQIITWNPPNWSGPLVNYLVGADSFYNAGIYGQSASAANVEAFHAWSGHETLTQVSEQFTGTGALGSLGDHATAVTSVIAGRGNLWYHQAGIAFFADIKSGAIATVDYGNGSFDFTTESLISTYSHFFGQVDTINSSWGGGGDPTGSSFETVVLDGLALQNPRTTFVVAAGNSGPGANQVGGPANGYNSISVAALGNANTFDQLASFSSGGPQDYWDPIRGTVSGVRAAVDVAAPGEDLVGAAYVPGNPQNNLYYTGIAGTSFAAPIVTGGATLMDSASRLYGLNDESRDARVIKSVLMTSADKISGWDNGQSLLGGVVTTTQGLDYYSGAGSLDLHNTYTTYLTGTRDVAGLGGGNVNNIGWDYGALNSVGAHNDYVINQALQAGTMLTTTLDWFRNRGTNGDDSAFADLNLEVWDSTFTHRIARSVSQYNNTEHLYFSVPTTGNYGLRVTYNQQMFGDVGATDYGLSWSGTPSAIQSIPEPGVGMLFLLGGVTIFATRRIARPRR